METTTTSTSPGTVDENARRRFEEARRQGRPGPIEQFLPPEDDPHYLATLEELVHIELEWAWKSWGQIPTTVSSNDRAPSVEDYLARFSRLRQPPIVVRLVQQEYRVRHAYGDRPSCHEYCARFPEVIATGREVEGSLAVAPTTRCPGSTEADALQVPGYEVLGLLGQGGMGVVHKGRDPDLGRDIAVKVLRGEYRGDPEFLRRFVDEARINGQLQHPGVVPVHELGWLPDGRPFFTMKLVQGRTLAELLEERADRTHDLPRFLTIFEQICQALAHAHAQGVIHRDLKPSNVMVGGFGEVQVMDWGLAKALPRAGDETPARLPTEQDAPVRPWRAGPTADETQPGQVVGTPAFMPPEQARGEVERLDERTDVFGLGGILCAILTGQPAYVGHDSAEVYHLASCGEVGPAFTRLDGCAADAELVRLCKDCLAPELAARPRDAGVVARRMTAHQAGVRERLRQAELERAGAQVQAREARKRFKLAVGLALAVVSLLVVGGGGGAWYLQQRTELRRGTELALATSAGLRDAGRWKDAMDILEQAESRLATSGPADLRRRVAQAQADAKLARRLDDIRQKRATLVDGDFDDRAADLDYVAAFRAAGLWNEGETEEVVAARIRESAIRGHLVAALDDWANVVVGWPRRVWLLGVASRAGEDGWGARFRDPRVWGDENALRQLVDEANVAELSPQLLTTVGLLMRAKQMNVVPWWTAAQRKHPNDFWLNYYLGIALRSAKKPGEAVGYYRAALAVRPDSVAARLTLGNALKDNRQLDEAILEYRRALDLDPGVTLTHVNLGLALYARHELDEAIKAYRRALAIDRKYVPAHVNLGLALKDKRQLGEAIEEFRQAIALDPAHVPAHNNLGLVLLETGRSDEAIEPLRKVIALDPKRAAAHTNLGSALVGKHTEEGIAEFRKAAQLDPTDARAYCGLGLALVEQGSFAEARTAFRRCQQLRPEGHPLRNFATQRLQQHERAMDLDAQLAAVLKGQARPADAAERLALADHCRQPYKRLYAASARFYAEAVEAPPGLAADLRAGHRYHAARAAALASVGKGEDAAKLDDRERADLRKQALDWLRADLALWSKRAGGDDPNDRAGVQKQLEHWQTDPDLAGVRDKDALGKLLADEQKAWRKLWDDVSAVLKRASEPR